MADQTIPDLTDGVTPATGDLIEVARFDDPDYVSRKVPIDVLANLATEEAASLATKVIDYGNKTSRASIIDDPDLSSLFPVWLYDFQNNDPLDIEDMPNPEIGREVLFSGGGAEVTLNKNLFSKGLDTIVSVIINSGDVLYAKCLVPDTFEIIYATSGVVTSTPPGLADLPSAATAGFGARATINDALLPTFGAAAADGGAVTVPVYSDGTIWRVG